MLYKFRVSNASEHRHKDENGYITVDESPILRTGILEYYGSELLDGDPGDELKLDGHTIYPDKVYKVFIPEDELKKGAESFRLLPIVNGHEWLGTDGSDARDYQEGTTGETVAVKDGFLYVPLKFTGAGIISDLESGDKQELSASYTNKLSWASNTDEYDLVASDIKGNHVALVDKGRCGPDVRVLNQKMESKTMKTNNELKLVIDGKEVDLAQFFKNEDVKEEQEQEIETDAISDTDETPDATRDDDVETENEDSVDKRALIDEIGGILKDKGLDEEIIRTIIGKAEKIAYDASETSESDNELPDENEAPAGEDDDKEVENACKSKNADEDDDKREDVAARVANAIKSRDNEFQRAYNAAASQLGNFNPFGMSPREMLVRALNHAGVETTGRESARELYAMLRVCNSAAVRVDNGFDYGTAGSSDEVEIAI